MKKRVGIQRIRAFWTSLAAGTIFMCFSAHADTYSWDCNFESHIVLWAASYKAQYGQDSEIEAIEGVGGVLDSLAGTAGQKLSPSEQGRVVTLVRFAYERSQPDETPAAVAMDYFRACQSRK